MKLRLNNNVLAGAVRIYFGVLWFLYLDFAGGQTKALSFDMGLCWDPMWQLQICGSLAVTVGRGQMWNTLFEGYFFRGLLLETEENHSHFKAGRRDNVSSCVSNMCLGMLQRTHCSSTLLLCLFPSEGQSLSGSASGFLVEYLMRLFLLFFFPSIRFGNSLS